MTILNDNRAKDPLELIWSWTVTQTVWQKPNNVAIRLEVYISIWLGRNFARRDAHLNISYPFELESVLTAYLTLGLILTPVRNNSIKYDIQIYTNPVICGLLNKDHSRLIQKISFQSQDTNELQNHKTTVNSLRNFKFTSSYYTPKIRKSKLKRKYHKYAFIRNVDLPVLTN